MEGCFVSPFPPSDALRRNPDHAKSADHWPYHLCGNPGRGSHRLGDQTTPAKASSDRRDKRPCLGIYGSGCYGFGAGAWTADLERQYLVQRARGRSDHAIGAILRLDQMLRRYGRDTDPATSDLFPDDPADVSLGNPSTYELLQRL